MGIFFSQNAESYDIESIESILARREKEEVAALIQLIEKARHNVNDANEYYDKDGITLLVKLIFTKRVDLFTDALKIHGINPNVKCDYSKKPPQAEDTIGFNHWAMFSNGNTALQVAVKEGLIGFVEPLLNTPGCDSSILDKDDNTLLHLVARGRPYLNVLPEKANHVALLKLLLSHTNIPFDAINHNGKTAEQVAKENNQTDIFEILMEKRLERKYRMNELPTLLSPRVNPAKNLDEHKQEISGINPFTG